ncbi:MAG: hypothetical protein K2K98_09260 [Muribaculaceae bacterium]|nr:hypothetical protein [Muribaculaceae bacterium]
MSVKCKASRKIRFAHIPADGNPGLTIMVTPSTLTYNTSKSVPLREVQIDVFQGDRKLSVNDFSCSALAATRTITKGLTWSYSKLSDSFKYRLAYEAGNDINISIPFTVTVNGVEYPHLIGVQTVKNGINGTGSDGRNGVWVPPMMLWSDYPDDYVFQAGDPASGDVRLDMVLVKAANGNLIPYYCLETHVKGDSPYSPETDTEFWAPADAGVYKCLATELLAAQNARIDFMSGQAIRVGNGAEMCGYFGAPTDTGAVFYTGANNVAQATFVVYKDGLIVAKSADIEGRISASTLDLKVSTAAAGAIPNGSLCFDVSSVKLPALASGYVRSIRIYNPLRTRTAPEDLTLIPENSTVKISTSLAFDIATSDNKTLAEYGKNGDVYLELLGININNVTTWTVNVLASSN